MECEAGHLGTEPKRRARAPPCARRGRGPLRRRHPTARGGKSLKLLRDAFSQRHITAPTLPVTIAIATPDPPGVDSGPTGGGEACTLGVQSVRSHPVILTFRDQTTEDIFDGADTKAARKVAKGIWESARRKLDQLNLADDLTDLAIPPANRLKALRGDLAGFHSIRINDQFRVVFRFSGGNATDVQVTDYH